MKSLNFNTNPTNQLKEYLIFLEKAGYKISLCNLGGSFCPSDEIPPRFFLHDNDYCSAVKKQTRQGALQGKKNYAARLKTTNAFCPCVLRELRNTFAKQANKTGRQHLSVLPDTGPKNAKIRHTTC